MITVKLPIRNEIDISSYLREFNSCMRFSYNRLVEKYSEKDIRHLIKNKNVFNKLSDSWVVQCAIREGKSWFEKVPDGKLVFGGKRNLKLRSDGKIFGFIRSVSKENLLKKVIENLNLILLIIIKLFSNQNLELKKKLNFRNLEKT